MSMMEERKDWAANTAAHSKRMYDETSNPYYVIAALAATNIGDFLPPDWALKVLLDGVKRAWTQANRTGEEVSLDNALGLHAKRGGTPPRRSAKRASVEDAVFRLVKIVHACFDVSIPVACEIVHYSIDDVFAEDMEENLWKPSLNETFSDQDLKKLGMTRKQYDEIQGSEKSRSIAIIETGGHSDVVAGKLRAFNWWSVTRGDRLGYSLDQLIDRYYRVGSKRKIPHGKASEQTMVLFEGYRLLRTPALCTHKITIVEREGYRIDCESALASVAPRRDFQQFLERVNSRA
jgi:hypothetical protein